MPVGIHRCSSGVHDFPHCRLIRIRTPLPHLFNQDQDICSVSYGQFLDPLSTCLPGPFISSSSSYRYLSHDWFRFLCLVMLDSPLTVLVEQGRSNLVMILQRTEDGGAEHRHGPERGEYTGAHGS